MRWVVLLVCFEGLIFVFLGFIGIMIGMQPVQSLCVSVFIPKTTQVFLWYMNTTRIKTLTQRKLQPEGPIPVWKLVRKMTLCAT